MVLFRIVYTQKREYECMKISTHSVCKGYALTSAFCFGFVFLLFFGTLCRIPHCVIFSQDADIHQVLQLPEAAAVPNLQAGELNARECMLVPRQNRPFIHFSQFVMAPRNYGAITTQHLCHTSPTCRQYKSI